MQLRMRHCSLINIPFRPFTHHPIVLIKQFLASVNRDGCIYTAIRVHTHVLHCVYATFTHTHARRIIRLAIVRRICI